MLKATAYNVVCTNDEAFEDTLTQGREYRLFQLQNSSVQLVNDKGEMRWYGTGKFRIVLN